MNNRYKYIDKNGNFPILGAFVVGILLVGSTGSTARKPVSTKPVVGVTSGVDVIMGAAPKSDPKPKPDGTTGKERTTTSNKNKATNTSIKVVEPKLALSKALDVLQFILDIIGFIPGLGDVCDGINALIYYARSLYLDAVISQYMIS